MNFNTRADAVACISAGDPSDKGFFGVIGRIKAAENLQRPQPDEP
jgi:hypothetical protein